MQIAAPMILQDVVKHFLILENEQAVLLHQRLSPDGHAGMVFCYRPLFAVDGQTLLPASFVYGQISRFHDLVSKGQTGMLVAVLQPYALHMLSGIPAQALTDQFIPLPLVFGKAGAALEAQLLQAADNSSRMQLIVHFLGRQLQQRPAADNRIREGLRAIYASNGWMPVKQISDVLHLGERQLERTFGEQIGLSPKQFLRTIRFRALLKSLQQQPSINLTHLAHDAGYYDQPHFNREFRMMAGITPKQYTTQTRLLALNFMQLIP
jgi:AraC-like DNA-binding protein